MEVTLFEQTPVFANSVGRRRPMVQVTHLSNGKRRSSMSAQTRAGSAHRGLRHAASHHGTPPPTVVERGVVPQSSRHSR